MVTIQPCCSANPRANAMKGWTSPRVPRVITNACLGYALSSSALGTATEGQHLGIDSSTTDTSNSQGRCGGTAQRAASPRLSKSIHEEKGFRSKSPNGTRQEPKLRIERTVRISYNVNLTLVFSTTHFSSGGVSLHESSTLPHEVDESWLPSGLPCQLGAPRLEGSSEGKLKTRSQTATCELVTTCVCALAKQASWSSTISTHTDKWLSLA
mmetsp:Transcript_16935/g.43169  ORF Transcript_16935/g.43169 Transcript_16935/m.43169 type:complete len:211 (+) Transcript_16935:1695-2327(+)